MTNDGLWYKKFRRYVIGGMDPDEAHKRADLDYPNNDGWQMAPVEPTEEMLVAGRKVMPFSYSDSTLDDIMRRVYHAMLAAAPKQIDGIVEPGTRYIHPTEGFEVPKPAPGDLSSDTDDVIAAGTARINDDLIKAQRDYWAFEDRKWNEAIEAAAKVADGFESAEKDADIIADRIRALKKDAKP